MINKILKERKLTARQLSDMTGINISAIQKYSCGARKPTVENAKKIGKALGIDWWLLFTDNVQMPKVKEER